MVQLAQQVLVGGGSGFVGRHLVNLLRNHGSKVQVITRKPKTEVNSLSWKDIEKNGLPKNTTAVINLAGLNIMSPNLWTQSLKDEIYSSRIKTNQILVKAIHDAPSKPSSFVTISGVGYYKPDDKYEYKEDWTQPENPHDRDYLMNLAHDWENSGKLDEQLAPNTRRTVIRSGVVLGADGGVAQKMRLPFSLGLGGALGSGQQWFPWIHVDDLVEMFRFAVNNEHVNGVINGVAPEQVRNIEFSKTFAQAFKRRAITPVPEFVLKLGLGRERADILLKGQRVGSRAGLLGFRYKYPRLESACAEIARR